MDIMRFARSRDAGKMQPHGQRSLAGERKGGAVMRGTLKLLLIVVTVGAIGAAVAAEPVRGFGFGGPMAMAFLPDMTGVNTFLSENSLPSMGDVLLGVGGGGRGGVIGGPVFGGSGWGLFALSANEDRSAELVFGGGGVDVGYAVGGDESSVLTLGAVLGGGANVLSVSLPAADPEAISSNGLVIESKTREIGRAIGFVQPYLSMAAQFLPWMGFELRVGYVFPVFGVDFGGGVAIPASRLDLSGPTVSVGLTFGGISSGEEREEDDDADRAPDTVTLTRGGSFALGEAEELTLENAIGDIVVESYRAEIEGTGAGPVVEWSAVLTARECDIDGLQIEADVSGLRAAVRTVGRGRVDYRLRVPAGVDLKLENGTGTIKLNGHEAGTIVLENGAGEVTVAGARATALVVAAGLGSVEIGDVEADVLVASVGVGEIVLELPADASAELTVRASLGSASIERFPGMVGGVHGFLGKRGIVTLGGGERSIELTASIGSIDVVVREP